MVEIEMSEKIARVTVHVLVITSLFLLLFSPFFESQTEQIGLVCADGVERQLPDAYPDALSNDAKKERTAKCWGYEQANYGHENQKLNNRLKKGFTTENIQKGVDWHTGKMDATCSLSNVHFMIQALDYKVNNEGLPWHSPERIMPPTSPMGGADMSSDDTLAVTQTNPCSSPDPMAMGVAINAYFDQIYTYSTIRAADDATALKTALENIADADLMPSDGSLTKTPNSVITDFFGGLLTSAARLRTNTSSIMLRSRRDVANFEYGVIDTKSCFGAGTIALTAEECEEFASAQGVEYVTRNSPFRPSQCYAEYSSPNSQTSTPLKIGFNIDPAPTDSSEYAAPICNAAEKKGILNAFEELLGTYPEVILGFLAGRGEFPCAAFSKTQCGQCGSAKSNIGEYDQLTETVQCQWVENPKDAFGICAPSALGQLFYKGNDKNLFEAEATIPGACFEKGKEDFTIPSVWHTTDVRSGPLYFENNGTCGDRGGLAYIPSYPSCVIKNVLDSEFPDSAIMLITSIVLYFIITVVSFINIKDTMKNFVEFTFLVTFVFTVATAGVITDTLIKAHPADTANGNDVFAQLFDAIYMLGLVPNGIKNLVAAGASLSGFQAIGGDADPFEDFDIGSILFGTPRAEIVDGRTFGTHNYVGWYHPHNSHVTPMATGAIVVLWVSLVVHIGISYRNRFTDEMAYVPLLG